MDWTGFWLYITKNDNYLYHLSSLLFRESVQLINNSNYRWRKRRILWCCTSTSLLLFYKYVLCGRWRMSFIWWSLQGVNDILIALHSQLTIQQLNFHLHKRSVVYFIILCFPPFQLSTFHSFIELHTQLVLPLHSWNCCTFFHPINNSKTDSHPPLGPHWHFY